jgi:Icc-related predicted phosphoesterase
VVGIEGAPRFPPEAGTKLNIGSLLYPQRFIERQISLWGRFSDKKLIIVSHAPPYWVLDYASRHAPDGKPRSIGSRPLRHFLEFSENALLCVCGHVHSCGGQDQTLGKSRVVNCASHDRVRDPNRVALIEINRGLVASVDWQNIPNKDSKQLYLW